MSAYQEAVKILDEAARKAIGGTPMTPAKTPSREAAIAVRQIQAQLGELCYGQLDPAAIIIDAAFEPLRNERDLLIKKVRLLHDATIVLRNGWYSTQGNAESYHEANRLISELGEIE